MRVCPLCGEENLDSVESCKECGTYLGPVEVQPEPPAVVPQPASTAAASESDLDLPDWLRDFDKPVEPEKPIGPGQVTKITEPAKPAQPVQPASATAASESDLDLPDWLRNLDKPVEPEKPVKSDQGTELAKPAKPADSDELDESAEPGELEGLFDLAEQIRREKSAAEAASKPQIAEPEPPKEITPAAAVVSEKEIAEPPAAPAEQKAQPARQAAPTPRKGDTQPRKPIPSTPVEGKAQPAQKDTPARRKPAAQPQEATSSVPGERKGQPARQPAPTPRQGETQPRFQGPASAAPPPPQAVQPRAAGPSVRSRIPAVEKRSNPVGRAVALVGLVIVFLLIRSLLNNDQPAVSPSIPTVEVIATLPQTILTPKASPTGASSSMLPTPLPEETASALQVKKSINGQDGAILIEVPAGEFGMGLTEIQANILTGLCPNCNAAAIQSAMPVRQVFVSAFWIYQTEVTNAMYRRCEMADACSPPGSLGSATQTKYYRSLDFNHYPVLQVTWEDADAYCRWAGGRLPYEAEWEKAARGGEARLFPWGNSASDEMMANTDNTLGDTAQVGSYPAGQSPYGVLDMAGNVSEWVYDWYAADAYATSPNADPTGPASSPLDIKVVRGGSWADAGVLASSAIRSYLDPNNSSYMLGFRCVIPIRDPSAAAEPKPTSGSAASTQASPSTSSSTPLASTSTAVSYDPQGKIVYTCQIARQENHNQVCLMNVDGSGMKLLTPDNSFDSLYASLAPDGRSVVFSSNSSGRYEIYEYNLATGSLSRVTSGGIFYAPEISPDGSQIVATRETSSGEGIWVMDRDGDDLRAVYNPDSSSCVDPTWSPDGRQILFACGAAGSTQRQLYIINQDGGGLRQVTQADDLRGRSDWSPDGKTLATYMGGAWEREIYVMNVDGSALQMIGQPGGSSQAPSFSPDGNWIAFTSYLDRYGDDDGCEIYIMRADGSDIHRLTDNTYCDWQPRWGP